MPCHHALAEILHTCINAAGIAEDRKYFLFRTSRGHNGSILSDKPMVQSNAWHMIRKRAAAAGIAAEIGCHTFRATGITAYLLNGGALEHAQEMAAHESPRSCWQSPVAIRCRNTLTHAQRMVAKRRKTVCIEKRT
jgi:integrase